MTRPRATYRLQLHKGFPFAAATAVVPYLHDLGVSHLYASPIFAAMPCSAHGYDVTDPTAINPELGGRPAFDALVAALRAHDMGIVLDTVPNHMAAHTANPWWSDVLEYGEDAVHCDFFDLRWRHDGPRRYVELPLLSRPYRQALAAGELRLALDEAGFFVDHAGQRLPLDPATFAFILHQVPDPTGETFALLLTRASNTRHAVDNGAGAAAHRESGAEVVTALRLFPDRAALAAAVSTFNSGHAHALSLLDELIDLQSWRPVHWRLSAERMSYRRFFDINGLVGLRTELPAVFDASHALVLELVAAGLVDGLRIDHVDGMADPAGYLGRLRAAVAEAGRPDIYIVVEKILESGESLPAWPVAGTTGYEFAAGIERSQLYPAAVAAMRAAYADFVGAGPAYSQVLYDAKRHMLDHSFRADLAAVAERLFVAAKSEIGSGRFDRERLAEALEEVTLAQSAYRTYITGHAPTAEDEAASIRDAVATATRRRPDRYAANQFVGGLLLGAGGNASRDEPARLHFVTAWQQLTPPLIAKGTEDTAFFRYNASLALNEVGNSPGASLEAEAARDFELLLTADRAGLNASTTHDTKRSEDARARLLVLAELAPEFRDLAAHWHEITAAHRHADTAPSPNEEWYLYQSLIAAWPLELSSAKDRDAVDPTVLANFRERIRDHMTKAMREAKVATSWADPNPDHEDAVLAYVDAILSTDSDFLASFAPFAAKIAEYGYLQSLSLLLLKLALPGVPDFYQGCETWNFSLTDPDNRRPVDFDAHCRLLDALPAETSQTALADLVETWRDGRIKLYLARRGLDLRTEHPDLFGRGDATRLDIGGEHADDIMALARHHGDEWLLALAPRHFVALAQAGTPPLGDATWGDTTVTLPAGAPGQWHDALSGESVSLERASGRLSVAAALRHFPVGLFFGRSDRPG